MEEKDFISFESIKQTYGISNKQNLTVLFMEVYKDLSSRNPDKKSNLGVAKFLFREFMNLPVFICDKLFDSFDKDCNGYLSQEEFVNNLVTLYTGTFGETCKLIFNMLDFTKDGLVTKKDSKLFLSHLPLSSSETKQLYKFQMESLTEIDDIISKTFGTKENINFKLFLQVVENKTSDIFLQLYLFLYQLKPFQNEVVELLESSEVRRDRKNLLLSYIVEEPNPGKIKSPRRSSKLSPTNKFFQKIKFSNSPERARNSLDKNQQDTDKIFTLIDTGADDGNDYKSDKDSNSSSFIKQGEVIYYENWVSKLEKNQTRNYFVVIVEKLMIFFDDEKKKKLVKVISLSGCFIKEKGEKKIEGKTFLGFCLFVSGFQLMYYCSQKEVRSKFISATKAASGYQNIFDFYEMVGDVGEGKYGVVKLGKNKKTKEEVAIKIVKKEGLNRTELDLVRNEIDIMKICFHPNIVHQIANYENADFIFIVMEYVSGGDLHQFLLSKKKELTEEEAAQLIYQIAKGVSYLHNLGIVHRDLKAENIMITKDLKIKITDFGLSKVMGYEEKLHDSFGTLVYASPEVLQGKPYDFEIDVWSFGIICFFLLSRSFPFDDKDSNSDEIAKKVIGEELKFKKSYWEKRSKEVVKLISKCLVKEREKRISINEVLKDDWFKKYIKK